MAQLIHETEAVTGKIEEPGAAPGTPVEGEPASSRLQVAPEQRVERVYRHRLPVRIGHWINVVCLFILIMSGLQIFNAHPALYWGIDPIEIDHGFRFAQCAAMMVRYAGSPRSRGISSIPPASWVIPRGPAGRFPTGPQCPARSGSPWAGNGTSFLLGSLSSTV